MATCNSSALKDLRNLLISIEFQQIMKSALDSLNKTFDI